MGRGSRSKARTRGDPKQLLIALLIIALLVIPAAYVGFNSLFATLWQARAGPTLLTLTGDKVSLEELSAGPKTVNLVLSTQFEGRGTSRGLSVVHLDPEMVVHNPYPLPMALIPTRVPNGGGYYGPVTTATGGQGTVSQTTQHATTVSAATTAAPPAQTETVTRITGTPWSVGVSVQASGQWERMEPGPENSGWVGVTRPITIQPGSMLEAGVTVTHLQYSSARITVHLIRGTGAITSTADFILGQGESKTVTLTSPVINQPETFRVQVSVVAHRLAPSVVAVAYTYSVKPETRAPNDTNRYYGESSVGSGQPVQIRSHWFHGVVVTGSTVNTKVRQTFSASSSVAPLNSRITLNMRVQIDYEAATNWASELLLDIAYETIEVKVSGSSTQTYPVTVKTQYGDIVVQVPTDGVVVQVDKQSYNVRVSKRFSELVIWPSSAFYVRNVVTNLGDWSLSFEIVNQVRHTSISVRYTVRDASGYPFEQREVQVGPGSSMPIRVSAAGRISEAMIEDARRTGRPIRFEIRAELLSPYIPGVPREQSLEAFFNVPRTPATFTVTVKGPGSAEVYIGDRRIGGPGTYSAYVGDTVVVKAVPDRGAFLCSFVATEGSGRYLRYEASCRDTAVLGGTRLLPIEYALILSETGFTAELEFRSVNEPEVAQWRASHLYRAGLHYRVWSQAGTLVLEDEDYVGGDQSTGPIRFFRVKLRATWEVRNNWPFEIRVAPRVWISGSNIQTVPTGMEFNVAPFIMPPNSNRFITVEVDTGMLTIQPDYRPSINFMAEAELSIPSATGAEAVYNIGGDTWIVKTSGKTPLGGTGYAAPPLRLQGEPERGGRLSPPNTAAGRSGEVTRMAVNSGVATPPVTVPANNAYSYQEVEVPADVVSPATGRPERKTVKALEAPPSADLSKVRAGMPVVQPRVKAPAPVDPLSSIAKLAEGFFRGVLDFFARLFGGGR